MIRTKNVGGNEIERIMAGERDFKYGIRAKGKIRDDKGDKDEAIK